MPFEDGSGICVLTHTNVAIDEIKTKLGSKADILFKHPNFFGTIQSFVNKFLASRSNIKYYNSKIIINDNEISQNKLVEDFEKKSKNLCWTLSKFTENAILNRKKEIKISEFKDYFSLNDEDFKVIRKALISSKRKLKANNLLELTETINKLPIDKNLKINLIDGLGKKLEQATKSAELNKHNEIKFWKIDFVNLKIITNSNHISFESKSGKQFLQLKEKLFNKGFLTYEDSFSLALRYTYDYSLTLENYFSNRFPLLFVDEIQDTQAHQMDILNKIFNESVIKQYYGDPDQAIFAGIDGGKSAWVIDKLTEEGFERLEISTSMRFGKEISKCVNPFKKELNKYVIGKAKVKSLKPYIILYELQEDANGQPKVDGMLEKFKSIIDKHNLMGLDEYKNWKRKSAPFNAVGFIGKKKKDCLTINSYVDRYSKQTTKSKMHFNNLISYFQKRPKAEIKEKGTSIYYGLFINALIALLDQGNVKNDNRGFNPSSLKKYFLEKYEKQLNELRKKKYDLIKAIEFEDVEPELVKTEFIDFFKSVLKDDCFPSFHIQAFNNAFVKLNEIETLDKIEKTGNIKKIGDTEIKVGTIHSVKGETHMATLLLETINYNESEVTYFNDNNKIDYNLFCDKEFPRNDEGVRINGRLKTTYVALSRPTHLLCVAMSKERAKCVNFGGKVGAECPKYKADECNWDIVTI